MKRLILLIVVGIGFGCANSITSDTTIKSRTEHELVKTLGDSLTIDRYVWQPTERCPPLEER